LGRSAALRLAHLGHPRRQFLGGDLAVVIGVDGVRVTGRWLRPFVSYGEIRSVARDRTGVQLTRVDGTVLHLSTIAQSSYEVAALVRHIEEGMSAHRRGQGKDANVLARQGRPLAAWEADIRRFALTPAGFRDQALGSADFETLLADARAPADQRIGAALALRAIDPSAHGRIRIAADTSANQELQAALRACAQEEEPLDEEPLNRATLVR